MSDYKQEIIVVRFDEEMLRGFTGYDKANPDDYFEKHPRAKHPPFENIWGKRRFGLLPSWNKFLNVNDRTIQNSMKQHMADYTTYCIKKQKIKAPFIKECIVLVVQHKPDRSHSDNDNTQVKSSLDSLVHGEVLQEDNYTVVRYFGSFSVYDKEDPHTDLIIMPITDEYPFDIVMMEATNYIVELEIKYKIS